MQGKRAGVVGAVLATGLISAFTAGCGGFSVGDGDYDVVVVSVGQAKLSGCGLVSQDVAFDSSQRWIVYGAPNDKAELDVGSPGGGNNGDDATLSGGASSNGFTFSGTQIRGVGSPVKTTTTISVSMTVDGDAVSGTYETKVVCEGKCGVAGTCVESAKFSGTVVDDVSLQTQL